MARQVATVKRDVWQWGGLDGYVEHVYEDQVTLSFPGLDPWMAFSRDELVDGDLIEDVDDN